MREDVQAVCVQTLNYFSNGIEEFTLEKFLADIALEKKPVNTIRQIIKGMVDADLLLKIDTDKFVFICNTDELRKYFKKTFEEDSSPSKKIMTLEEFCNSTWRIVEKTDDHDEQSDDVDDIFGDWDGDDFFIEDDDLSPTQKRTADLQQLNKVRCLVFDFIKHHEEGESFLNVSFPDGSPVEIGVSSDTDNLKLYLTENGSVKRFLKKKLFDLCSDLSFAENLSTAIIAKMAESTRLVCIENSLGLEIDYTDYDAEDDWRTVSFSRLLIMDNLNLAFSKNMSLFDFLMSPVNDEELSDQMQAFLSKTMQNRYGYSDQETFKQVVLAFIKRILAINWRMDKQKSLYVSKTLKTYWESQEPPESSTLKIINRVVMELELASEEELLKLQVDAISQKQ